MTCRPDPGRPNHPTLQAPGQVFLGPGWWGSMVLGLLGILEPLLSQTQLRNANPFTAGTGSLEEGERSPQSLKIGLGT